MDIWDVRPAKVHPVEQYVESECYSFSFLVANEYLQASNALPVAIAAP